MKSVIAGVFTCARRNLFSILILASLAACGGGGGGDAPPPPAPFNINGGGVKGPMANATVTAYALDTTAPGFKGAVIGSGTTNDAAQIVGLSIPRSNTPPFILEFTSTPGTTTDITTGLAPVLSTMRTVLTQALIDAGDPVYATPQTTMATDIAIAKADSNVPPYTGNNDSVTSTQEFLNALPIAAAQVMGTLGFGASTSVNIWDTPPMIDGTTTDAAAQLLVAQYRTAVETLTAVAAHLATLANPVVSAEAMFAALANDIADDGVINSSGSSNPPLSPSVVTAMTLLDPTTMAIPYSSPPIPLTDIEPLLISERTITGFDNIDTSGLVNVFNPSPAQTSSSQDGDDIPDSIDLCPGFNSNDNTDTNNNGVGDACEVAPTAVNDDAGAVDEGGTLNGASVLANDTDPEGDTLTPALGTGPTHASSFTLNTDGTFTYVHDGNESTSDSFTYTVNDGSLDSAPATVTITINPVNDAPVATADSGYVVLEGGTLNVTNTAQGVLNNDVDVDGPSLTAVLDTNVSNGSLTLNPDGTFTYSHNGSETTSDSFTYHANDGSLDSNIVTVSITVTPQNDIPVANNDSINVNEGGTATTLVGGATSVRNNDTDVETPTASLTVSMVTPPSNGSLTLNTDGTFSYTHNGSETTGDSFTYRVHDGTDYSLPATVDITINPQNDVPVAMADSIEVDEGATVTTLVGGASSVRDNDTDAETPTASLTVSLVAGPTNAASFSLNADGTFSYAHNGSETISDSFTYRVNDGTANSTPAVVTITINPQNDPPVANDDFASVANGGTVSILTGGADSVRLNDTDVDTPLTSLIVALVTAPAHVNSFTLNTDGTFSYTHDGSATTTDSFTYTVSDGTDTSAPATVTITITDNQSPTANADSITVDEGGTVTVLDSAQTSVLFNDSDPESDPLTAVLDTAPAHVSSFTLNVDGTFSYTHNGSETTTDSFTYHANDGTTDSNIVTVSITINPVNDLPVAVNDSITVSNGGTATTLVGGASSVRDNDSDVETATSSLTVALVSGPSNATAFTLNTDGTFSYTHNGTATTSDSFTYVVNDGTDDSNTATVSITIQATTAFDITGTYFVESIITGDAPVGCSDGVGTVRRGTAITVTQSGSAITSLRSADGAQLAGTIDTVTGNFTLTGTQNGTWADLSDPGNDAAFINWSSDLTVLGGTTSGTPGNYVVSGTLFGQEDDNGDGFVDCEVTQTFTANFVYRHTGSEDYNGVYALESYGRGAAISVGQPFLDEWSGGEGSPIEFEISGSNLVLHGPPNMNGVDSFSNITFDPLSGYFSFIINYTDWNDEDGDGTAEQTSTGRDLVTGIFMRNPQTNPGTDGEPLVILHDFGYGRDYTGDSRIGTDVAFRAENYIVDLYAKQLDTQAITRTNMRENADQTSETQIVVGLTNPTWRISSPTSRLWLEVRDNTGQLCLVPYIYDSGSGQSGKYTDQIRMPNLVYYDPADGITPQYLFRGNTYSRVTCNTSLDGADRVSDGETLTVRVIDTGSDGLLDADGGTVPDTYVYDNTSYVADVVAPGDRYTQPINVFDIQVRGGTSSTTMAGDQIPLWGYFNRENYNTVTWNAPAADNYQIRLVDLDEPQPVELRYVTPGTANTRTIDPGVLGDRSSLQLVAVNQIGTGGPTAASFSRKLAINHGITGLFNIELGDNVPLQYRTIQVYLAGSWGSLTSCVVNNNPNVSCSAFASDTDFSTDIVTLSMTDELGVMTGGGTGSPFTLYLDFGATGRSDLAVVTSNLGSISNASARVANTEVVVRSRRYSNGDIESQAIVLNPRIRNGLYNRGVFRLDDAVNPTPGNLVVNGSDTGFETRFLWDADTVGELFSDVAASYIGLPTTDGVPQRTGRYVSKSTNMTIWGLGLGLFDPARYKFILRNIADSTQREIHRYDYTAPSPAAYIAPVLDNVLVFRPTAGDVTCVTAGACSAGSAVNVSVDNGNFNIRWTVPTPPAGSRWQLFFTDDATELQGRTPLMTPLDVGTLPGPGEIATISSGVNSTYEWTNGSSINLEPGQTVRVRLRVTNNTGAADSFTAFGVSSGEDQVYLTLP